MDHCRAEPDLRLQFILHIRSELKAHRQQKLSCNRISVRDVD